MAHPGEVSLAEAFCSTVQKRIGSIGAPGLSPVDLKVVSTVHTDIDMFVYSQPTVKEVHGAFM